MARVQMYGLVNKGLEQFIVARGGASAWARVAARAGEVPEVFVAMQGYPDAISYALVGAASEELGVPAADLLEQFGEFWILYTAEQGYGGLLDASGSSLVEFMANLDDLHARVALSYTELAPPSFTLERIDERTVELHYRTHRAGLAPMMIGLLRGLARRFSEVVEIEHTTTRDVAGHDVFRVTWP